MKIKNGFRHAAMVTAIATSNGWILTQTTASANETIGSLSPAPTLYFSPQDFSGQTFVVPAGETGVLSATLVGFNNGSTPDAGSFYIATYKPGTKTYSDPKYENGTLGAPLASVPYSVPPNTTNYQITADFNVPVTAGGTYAIVLDWDTPQGLATYAMRVTATPYYDSGAVVYQDNGIVTGTNNTTITRNDFDAAFQVNFGPVPEPASMGLLFSAAALLASRRRGTATR